MAAAVVAALTAELKLLGGGVNSTTAALALLLAVLFLAARMENGPALVASVLVMLCFNFYFLPPFGTIHIAEPETSSSARRATAAPAAAIRRAQDWVCPSPAG